MRATIDLPDSLFREMKTVAAQRGKSLKEIVRQAVEAEIRKPQSKVRKTEFPILSSKQPGSLRLTNGEIESF